MLSESANIAAEHERESIRVANQQTDMQNETQPAVTVISEFVSELTVGGLKLFETLDTDRLLDTVDEFHSDKIPNDTEVEAASIDSFQDSQQHKGTKKVGRIPYYKKYPSLINVVTEFLEKTGFSAQIRRRTKVGAALGMGATLQNLKKHVEAHVKGLVLCKQTVHHLFVAPRKGTLNAANYKGVVEARVAAKKNTM